MLGRLATLLCRQRTLGAILFSLALFGPAHGQDRNLAIDLANSEKLYDKELKQKFTELQLGERQPTAEDAKVVEVVARHYVYPLALASIEAPAAVQKLMNGFDAELAAASRRKDTTGAFRQLFAKQVAIQAKNVIDDSKTRPIGRMNAVRMLEHVSLDGQEDVADVLAEVLENKNVDDGSKYWAAHALYDLFAMGEMKDKKRQARCVAALLNELRRKFPVLPESKDVAAERQVSGVQFYRKEVIRALAETRYPAIEAPDKTLIRTAQEMLAIVRNEGLVPPARADEQAEAAIGVARLQPALFKNYQPDYAVQVLAKFIADYGNMLAEEKRTPQLAKDATRNKELLRYYAARLADTMKALSECKDVQEMAKQPGQKPAADYISETVKLCLEVLSSLDAPSNPALVALEERLAKVPAPNQILYKGVADSGFAPPSSSGGAELKTQDGAKPPQ